MYSSLECPRCGQPCKQLVIPIGGDLQCRACAGQCPSKYNPNLNQTYAKNDVVRLTNGKAWEIANRIVSPDDHKTMVNRITGKPAQY